MKGVGKYLDIWNRIGESLHLDIDDMTAAPRRVGTDRQGRKTGNLVGEG